MLISGSKVQRELSSHFLDIKLATCMPHPGSINVQMGFWGDWFSWCGIAPAQLRIFTWKLIHAKITMSRTERIQFTGAYWKGLTVSFGMANCLGQVLGDSVKGWWQDSARNSLSAHCVNISTWHHLRLFGTSHLVSIEWWISHGTQVIAMAV